MTETTHRKTASAVRPASVGDDLLHRVEALRPWRYNHARDGAVVITSDTPAARVFDDYASGLLTGVVSEILRARRPETLRAFDMGCLEGHNSAILCRLGFREVVGVDLSEAHVQRAEFLLKEFHGFENARVVQGNVGDERLMASLGAFDVVLFHGLLYHLRDPVGIFDVLDRLLDADGVVLLFTQYKMSSPLVVGSQPVAELQVKGREAVVHIARDGSSFDRCALRLNPAALFEILRAYRYEGMVAYDDPSKTTFGYNSNLILSKHRIPDLAGRLNAAVTIPGVRFYDWDGRSVNSYHFQRSIPARLVRALGRAQRWLLG